MRKWWLIPVAAMGVSTSTVFAQVDFSARLSHTSVLACEPVPIEVTLKNNRMIPLTAGGTQGFTLAFEVVDAQGLLVRALPNAVVATPAEVPALSQVVFTNDLQQLFPIAQHAALSIRARLVVGDRSYVTDKMFLDVLPGGEVARIQANTASGELRTYSLRVVSRDKRDRLFLRSGNEAETICYGVADLGRFVRIGNPTIEVDSQGNVHVLHLSGPNQFVHSVFSPDAMRISRRLVEGDVSAVRLVEDGAGSYRVIGAGQISPPREPMIEQLPLKRGL